jgi:hypothetical protein
MQIVLAPKGTEITLRVQGAPVRLRACDAVCHSIEPLPPGGSLYGAAAPSHPELAPLSKSRNSSLFFRAEQTRPIAKTR